MSKYVIYIKQGGYICKGAYSVQGESFKVLSSKIEDYTRIFKTRKSAENALNKMYGKYANLVDAEIIEIVINGKGAE